MKLSIQQRSNGSSIQPCLASIRPCPRCTELLNWTRNSFTTIRPTWCLGNAGSWPLDLAGPPKAAAGTIAVTLGSTLSLLEDSLIIRWLILVIRSDQGRCCQDSMRSIAMWATCGLVQLKGWDPEIWLGFGLQDSGLRPSTHAAPQLRAPQHCLADIYHDLLIHPQLWLSPIQQ